MEEFIVCYNPFYSLIGYLTLLSGLYLFYLIGVMHYTVDRFVTILVFCILSDFFISIGVYKLCWYLSSFIFVPEIFKIPETAVCITLIFSILKRIVLNKIFTKKQEVIS